MVDNKTILAKADFAVADLTAGGKLQPAAASAFMRLAIDNAVLMPMATVVPMRSHTQVIDQIRFGSRITRAGQENTALSASDRSKPTTSKVTLAAKLFKSEVRMSTESLEDSIEQGTLRQTILTLMAERIGLDIDDIVANGDTASADAALAQFDGMIKAATSNTVNQSSAVTNRALLKKMLRALPSKYAKDKRALRYLTSHKAEIDYRDQIGDRATVAGDTHVLQDVPAVYNGIPLMGVPVFPENLGGGTNETVNLLMDPKNMQIGMWRDITVETDKLISEGQLLVVVTFRMDFKYAVEEAVVKGYNVSVA